MIHVTGTFLIDVPAGLLNSGEGQDITRTAKAVRSGRNMWPYVSAQAWRHWLRQTMAAYHREYDASPVYISGTGKKQQAFTEGDPIKYWDDDLLGYMRAEKGKEGAGLTRMSVMRTSNLISLGPVQMSEDYGTMVRGERTAEDREGAVLHRREIYRTALRGMFSLNLCRVGRFVNEFKPGYRNLPAAIMAELSGDGEFVLPIEERLGRIEAILDSVGRVEATALQTLNYTNVAPAFVAVAVLNSGNNVLYRVVRQDSMSGEPVVNPDAIKEVVEIHKDDILFGPVFGIEAGYMETSRPLLERMGYELAHPRRALHAVAEAIKANSEWLD